MRGGEDLNGGAFSQQQRKGFILCLLLFFLHLRRGENTHPIQPSIKPKHANNLAVNAFEQILLDTGTEVNSCVKVNSTTFSAISMGGNKFVQDAVRKLQAEADMREAVSGRALACARQEGIDQ